ncbi:MAG: hypothetical protein IPM57_08940 [Oligoflexia bacterium]|nr:hypothetical protein [Oligoflexia bacterium]
MSESAKKQTKSDPSVISDDIERMKQEVLNKKTQMMLFKQLLKSEGIESNFPIVNIKHVNQMGVRYKIYSLTYTIDKDRVYTFHAEDNFTKQELSPETQVFRGPLSPGLHELLVEVIYQGNDTGVFSYINDYKIPSQMKKLIKVDKGQNLDIQIVGYEKGWALTDFKDRPDLKIKMYGSKQSKDLK